MSYDIPSISELEAIQLLNKHYAEVITSKKDGVSSAADITQTTNPITGVTRRTLYKILDDAQAEHDAQISAHEVEHDNQIAAHEIEHDAQITAHEVEHDNQMQSFENDFDSRLAGMAFTRVGSFATGATLTDMRQVLVWEVSQGGDGHEYGWAGTFPKVVAVGATPETSGGIGAGAWVNRSDVTLRSELAAPGGAGMVGFLQSGAGAVPRTAQDKMRERVSPEDKGAIGDGVAYDDAAIALAIAHVQAVDGELVGRGVYRCASGLVFPSAGRYNCDFTGAKFVFDAAVTNGATIGTVGSNPFRGIVRGLHLEKAAYVGSDVGILLLNCVEANVENPVIVNFSKSMSAEPKSSSRVAYNIVTNPTFVNHEYGFYAKPDATSYVNDNTMLGGRFASNVPGRLIDQLYLDNIDGLGVQHNRFLGVAIEGYRGGGDCGRTAIRAVNDANQNVFSFCRTEKYGLGWSSGFSAVFGANTSGNLLEDPRIDVTISDVSGLNQWDTRLGGLKRVGHNTSASAKPLIQLVRNQPLNDPATKFAIDVSDLYSDSGDAAFLKYTSARFSGNLIELTTAYGKVFAVNAKGEYANSMVCHGTENNYWAGRIGTLGSNNVTAVTETIGLFVFSSTSSNTGKVGAEFITNNVALRHHVSFSNPNGVVGSISTSATATTYNTASDERLKENIIDAGDSGALIDAIKVRAFDWKVNGAHQDYGFIAQELHSIYPEAVSAGVEEGGKPESMWSVDNSKLIPLMMKEIQNLRARITILEG